MGLGLTIARDLVVAHQGHLEVESTPGEGSQFTIRLPVPPQQKRS
jgi:signal transduction histidine kinase